MKRVALYVRVSTEEQKKHGLSVDAQLLALQAYCKENNFTIAGIYNDAGLSAHISYKKRPAMQKMIEDCKNRKIDIILFTKLDRFFRSVPDYYACIEQIGAIPWRAIWEDYETETSAGKFKVNIMLSIAQAEAERTSERIKAVNEYRRSQGIYTGKAPTGYKVVKGHLIKDEEIKDRLQQVFDYYSKTYSTAKTVDYAHSLGLTFARETFTRMLKNTAYYGEASHNYKCEPYITKEQYDKNYETVYNRRQTTYTNGNTKLFTGLLVCSECGRNFCGSIRRFQCGKAKKDYCFYICLGKRNRICENRRTVSEISLEKLLLSQLEKSIDNYNYEVVSNNNIDENKKLINQLENKLKRIGDRYEDGDITREEYKTKRVAIISELDILKKQTKDIEPKKLPDNWLQIYEELDKPHRRAFWFSVLSKIVIYPDKKLRIKIIF